MAHHMRAHSWKGLDMDKEIGNHQEMQEISILEPMKVTRKVAMEDMYGQMDVYTKVISKTIISKSHIIQAWKGTIDIPRWQRD